MKEHGALDRLDGNFLTFAVGIPMNAEIAAAVETYVHLVQVALAPWKAGQMYLNFSERPIGARSAFEADNYRRLREIKAACDPEDLVRSNHPIPPAPAGRRERPALRRRSRQIRAAQVD